MTNLRCDLPGNESGVAGVGKTVTMGAWIIGIHQLGAAGAAGAANADC